MDVLDVDLVRFERGDGAARRAVVDGVRRSLATGFVYARHDLPAEIIDGAYEMLAAFFHLPDDVKRRHVVPGSQGQTGYTGALVETAAGADAADWKEMLNWSIELPELHPLRRRYPHRYMPRAFPDEIPGFAAACGLLHDRLQDLQRRFLRIIALGVGCDESYFEGIVHEGPTLTRAIRYPPMERAPGADHVWAAEHGDINLITALPRATARGLQIKTEDGGWIDAAPPDGCAIINSGLMLERVTNGALPAGIHRVVADPEQTGERISVVQFCHPTPWTILAPIPACVTEQRPLRAPPVLAADWLDQVLHDINLSAG